MQTNKQASSVYHNIVSLMATIALMSILSSKRWKKAVSAGNTPPDNLVKDLEKSMATCRDKCLNVPAKLQAMAVKYSGQSSTR